MEGALPTGPMGRHGKIVKADETFAGGKFKNRAHRKPAPKKAIPSLVERGGSARSFQLRVTMVTAKDVPGLIVTNIDLPRTS